MHVWKTKIVGVPEKKEYKNSNQDYVELHKNEVLLSSKFLMISCFSYNFFNNQWLILVYQFQFYREYYHPKSTINISVRSLLDISLSEARWKNLSATSFGNFNNTL